MIPNLQPKLGKGSRLIAPAGPTHAAIAQNWGKTTRFFARP